MLFLLRNIRRKMLGNNKFTTYFLYAIGEILLVVIGILIAVSIDDWSQQQKNLAIEKEILTQLRQDLTLALKDLEWNIEQYEQALISTQIILDHMDSEQPYSDEIGEHFTRAFPWAILIIDQGGYEAFKTEGIDIIRNVNLRNQIINLMEGRLYFHRQMEALAAKQSELMFREKGGNYFKSYGKGWSMENGDYYSGKTEPINYQQLRHDQSFRFHLETQIPLFTSFQKNSNYRIRNGIKKIIAIIDEELEKEK